MSSILRLPVLLAIAFFAGMTGAWAQTAGPDEGVTHGTVNQSLALSPAQRSAIYNAVIAQRGRTPNPGIAVAIGAPVPPSAALRDLPEQGIIGSSDSGLLKYAMVEDDIVVVDPISMRVVDVIHGGTQP